MPADIIPFYADPKNIADRVNDKTYRVGLYYFNNNCVLECDVFADHIEGSVEAQDSELPWFVKITLDADSKDALSVSCYCENTEEEFCSHAVATLLQCSDQHQQEQKQGELQLQETALLDRIKKGKKEVNVYSLETVENVF